MHIHPCNWKRRNIFVYMKEVEIRNDMDQINIYVLRNLALIVRRLNLFFFKINSNVFFPMFFMKDYYI
jgi:hypothetical protein